MEFKTLFQILKKHLADGYDVPHFFRDLMAMLTEVSEEEWGTSKDPSQEGKDKSLRSYVKCGLPKKLAQIIVYRLTPENTIDSINSHGETQRRLKLLEMSLEYGLYPSQADLESLQEFFPDVNIRKLYEVENYHQKFARILDDQFESERQAVLVEIEDLEEQRKEVNAQIKALGFVGNISKEFLDRHSELKGTIDALKTQNESYLTLHDLKEAKKLANDQLKNAIRQILTDIEQTINAKMAEYNSSLYAEHHNPPKLTIKEYNSFTFETKGDDGTASAYKGMIIYDLAVLNTTGLPAIAHDSLLYGDLGFKLVEGIMKLYMQNIKQVFISFDKQEAHTPETQRILEDHTVIRLSDGTRKLYGQSWDTETEDES